MEPFFVLKENWEESKNGIRKPMSGIVKKVYYNEYVALKTMGDYESKDFMNEVI